MYKITLTIYPITDYDEDLKQVEPIEVSYEGNDAYQMKINVDDVILRTMNNSNDTKAFVEFLMEHNGEYFDHDEQWIYVDIANNCIKHGIEEEE